ncbi:MAG: trehalase family glycosidase [Anaerolineae bacterium]
MTIPNDLVEKARAVLRQNLVVTADGHRYTRPAPMTYEQQWLWDSCFHAIVNTHLDHTLAKDEIEALLAHQMTDGPDEGMVPHMTYWDGGGEALWGRSDRSTITQPPVIAYAVERVFAATQDIAFVRRVYPALQAYHAWWLRRRDPDGDNLVSAIHPWETGWDASPAWDAPMGLRAPSDVESRRARMALVATLGKLDYDIERAQAAGLFTVESCDLNAFFGGSLVSMARLSEALGLDEAARGYRQQADATAAAIQTRCWDETAGVFRDLAGRDEVPLPEFTATTFVPLFAAIPTTAQAARLVSRLTDPAQFWPAYPLPTVALSEPLFAPDRYWRGPSWVHLNWLVYHGLLSYGYQDIASDLAARTFAMVEGAGFWEYYNPLTGAGLGAHPQSWTTLVLDFTA